MNFFKYIGVTKEAFINQYLHTGLVNEAIHPTFPLNIFSYSRKAVHDNVWDNVTSRTRGIIVNRFTDEIVARPFEKFHNYGSEQATEDETGLHVSGEPVIWEKMDGFMVTMYEWEGKYYAASKGSFTSPHAKWATAEIQRKMKGKIGIAGTTFVFEGLHPDLRIVVDYGKRKSLVLLAVIYNDTGEEVAPEGVEFVAGTYGFDSPTRFDMSLDEARVITMTCEDKGSVVEGYVLTWYRTGGTPYRLKMKYVDYLRLHRMVTGVSPKRIWELLATKQSSQIDDYLNSTPWFSKFVTKWLKVLRIAYDERKHAVEVSFGVIQGVLAKQYEKTKVLPLRKDWAMIITRPEFKPYKSELFAMLDGKDLDVVIWKQLREMTKGVNPMVDAHNF